MLLVAVVTNAELQADDTHSVDTAQCFISLEQCTADLQLSRLLVAAQSYISVHRGDISSTESTFLLRSQTLNCARV